MWQDKKERWKGMMALAGLAVVVGASGWMAREAGALPRGALVEARSDLARAEKADAERLAPAAWAEARDLVAAADEEIRRQERRHRLVRRSERARALVERGERQAEAALRQALEGRRREVAAARETLDLARAAIAAIHGVVAEAPRGRDMAEDRLRMRRDVAELEEQLGRAETHFEVGDYRAAASEASAVAEEAVVVHRTVQLAASHRPAGSWSGL